MQFHKPKYFLEILKILTFAVMFLWLPAASEADPLENWVTITSGTDHWFYGLTYSNGKFVLVGDYGTIMTSSDGVAWTDSDSGVTNHLYGIGFGNNTFIAVGTLGKILSSPDGITWTVRSEGQAHPVSQNLYGVAYDGTGKFVVVGGHGTIRTSTDNGVTWVDPFYASTPVTDNWLFAAVYDYGTFIDVGASGTILSSPDGDIWGVEASPTALHLNGVAYGNSIFAAVGESGTVLTSTDGSVWTAQSSGITDWLRGVTYDNGYFVAVGDQGTILTSPDGINWSLRYWNDSFDLEDVAFDSTNSAFAAVGGHGTILLDGETIPTLPVRLSGAPPEYYNAIQTAYDVAENGETVQSQALHFNEDLTFDRDVAVKIEGGYDSAYGTKPIGTTVNGTVTISSGTIVMEDIIIK